MTSRNILYVALSPLSAIYSSSIRNEGMIKALLGLGYNIDIITTRNQTGLTRVGELPTNNKHRIIYLDDKIATDYIQRMKRKPSGFVSAIRWFFQRLSVFEYQPKSYRNIDKHLFLGRKYDLVVSSSDPKVSHLVTKRILPEIDGNKRWIQYWGDPLADDITRKLVYPKAFLVWIEGKILGLADKIVYTSPVTLKRQSQFFPRFASKMQVLPTPAGQLENLPERCARDFVIGYHGAWDPDVRDLSHLVNAVRELASDWKLEIVGPISFPFFSSATNVRAIGAVSDLTGYQAGADLLVVVMNKRGGQLPGKIYHMAGLNREILVIIDGECGEEMAHYLRGFERYHICRNTVGDIKAALYMIRKEGNLRKAQHRLCASEIGKAFVSV